MPLHLEKRMLSSMSPTIVSKDGVPLLVTGSPGGSTIITTTLQIILNVVTHEMPLEDAVSLPRFHHQWKPDRIIYETYAFSPDTLRTLEKMGHVGFFPWPYGRGIGDANSVLMKDGKLYGVKGPACRRSGGRVLMPIRFLVIDGFNLIRRIYEARIHKEKHQGESSSVSGEDMKQVVDAAKSSLARALNTHQPTHAAVVMEQHDKTWRHLLYPEYKANRSETPPMLMSKLPQFEAAFAELGVRSFGVESYEADDVVATLAAVVAKNNGEVVILSTDKIYLQLVNDKVIVYDHFADQRCDRNYIKEKYGIVSSAVY